MNKMWKKVFILLSAYLSAISFAVLGGVVWYKKDEDEDVKKTVKLALIVTLIFTGLSAILSFYNYFGSLWSHYYSTGAYEAYSILNTFVNIAKIVTYTVLIIKVLVDKTNKTEAIATESFAKEKNVKETNATSNKKSNNTNSNKNLENENTSENN